MNGAGQTGRDAAEVESLVDSFCGVTSASREEALFFLESHGWALDPAIESFYEDEPQENPHEEQEEEEEEENNNEEEEEERGGEEADSEDEDYVPSENEEGGNTAVARPPVAVRVGELGSRGKGKARNPSRRSAITTFSDLKGKAGSDSDSETDSDEDQDYYTGGEKR